MNKKLKDKLVLNQWWLVENANILKSGLNYLKKRYAIDYFEENDLVKIRKFMKNKRNMLSKIT